MKFAHFQYGVHLIGTFNQNYQIEGFYSTLFMTSPFIVNINLKLSYVYGQWHIDTVSALQMYVHLLKYNVDTQVAALYR